MSTEIKAPAFPESIADGTVATWHKQPGEPCARDELIVDIETDKVVLEVNAPADGALQEIIKQEGDTVLSQETLAIFVAGDIAEAPAPAVEMAEAEVDSTSDEPIASPAAKKMMAEHNIAIAAVSGTGKGGRITKEDVQAVVDAKPAAAAASPAVSATPMSADEDIDGDRPERRVAMTRLRARVAERLLNATQTTAMLTTFNEVNMQPVMALRKKYKEQFEKSHNGTRLGFMSFFVRAATEALKRFPAVNASIDGDDIVYHGYYDVGVAVSSDRGLVVPVLRDADQMSLASIESKIREFGGKAQSGKLSIEDMTGGTFTITKVPKINLLPFNLGMRPRSPNSIMMIVVRGLNSAQCISRRRTNGMNITRFLKNRIYTFRWINHFILII